MLQTPALQTRSVPQTVPFGSMLAVIVQVMVGEQEVMPVRQGLDGTQDSPAVQLMQPPLLQTRLVPQPVPSATLPDSTQVGDPVLQVVTPVRQGRPGTEQLAPAAHAVQVPCALQTRSCPHGVPGVRLAIVSVQTADPDEQSSIPTWQGFVGVQEAPVWQVTHMPAWQTIPVPQPVPFGRLSSSVQTDVPVVQTVVPVLQGLPVGEQSAPAVHAAHVPSRQTMF
jgi:hypothetical protein